MVAEAGLEFALFLPSHTIAVLFGAFCSRNIPILNKLDQPKTSA